MSAKWSEAENDWLRRRYGREHMPRLLVEFEREFGRATTAGAVFQKAHKMGLTNNAAKAPQRAVRAVHWGREPEMQSWMLEHDDGQAIPELSAQFAAAFGFPLSRPQISLWRASNGRNTRISHGGRRPLPVGAERYGKGKGYVLVKVAESPTVPQSKDNWRLKHVVEYERAHGPVPDGCNVVMANRNPRDFSPGNLVAVPSRLMARINSIDSPDWNDAESLRACIAWCELNRAVNDAEMRMPRRCGVCGREFTPQGKSNWIERGRRTCPECLAKGKKAKGAPRNPRLARCAVCGREFVADKKSRRRCDDCVARLPRHGIDAQISKEGRCR